MQEYRIDKLRRSVSLVLADGKALTGDVFLQPRARLRSTPEEPIDLMNGEEPFFVLSMDDGVVLVAKEEVARLETSPPEADNPLEFPHLGIDVEIVFSGGAKESGCIFPETPAGRSRLIDFLNSFDQRFLAVYSADKVCLVNRRLISRVRQLS